MKERTKREQLKQILKGMKPAKKTINKINIPISFWVGENVPNDIPLAIEFFRKRN